MMYGSGITLPPYVVNFSCYYQVLTTWFFSQERKKSSIFLLYFSEKAYCSSLDSGPCYSVAPFLEVLSLIATLVITPVMISASASKGPAALYIVYYYYLDISVM